MLKKRIIAFALSAAIGAALAFGITAAFPSGFTDGSIREGLCYATTGVCPDTVVAAVDGAGMGLGFTLALTLIGAIRELIGNGTLFNLQVMPSGYQPMLLFVLAPGGFIVFGLILGIVNAITAKIEKNKEDKEAIL